jgi:hypothetical protein
VDTALIVACISGVVALGSVGLSGWTQLHVTKREGQSKERADIAELDQRYLVPLRYYAQALSHRLEEIQEKLRVPEQEKEMREWFKHIKDHVTHDLKDPLYRAWCYYVGIFSVSTLSHFHPAFASRTCKTWMALASCPARQGQQRSLRRIRQSLSCAFALSPGERSFACALLASFCDCGLFLPR